MDAERVLIEASREPGFDAETLARLLARSHAE